MCFSGCLRFFSVYLIYASWLYCACSGFVCESLFGAAHVTWCLKFLFLQSVSFFFSLTLTTFPFCYILQFPDKVYTIYFYYSILDIVHFSLNISNAFSVRSLNYALIWSPTFNLNFFIEVMFSPAIIRNPFHFSTNFLYYVVNSLHSICIQ